MTAKRTAAKTTNEHNTNDSPPVVLRERITSSDKKPEYYTTTVWNDNTITIAVKAADGQTCESTFTPEQARTLANAINRAANVADVNKSTQHPLISEDCEENPLVVFGTKIAIVLIMSAIIISVIVYLSLMG